MSFRYSQLLGRSISGETRNDPEKTRESDFRRSSRLVILADSDRKDRQQMLAMLQHLKFEVVEAADGITALAIARQTEPCLILASQTLLEIDRIHQKLRKDDATARLPFCFILPAGQSPDALPELDPNLDSWVQRPITVSQLDARIQALLARLEGAAARFTKGPHLPAGELNDLAAGASHRSDEDRQRSIQAPVVDELWDRLENTRSGETEGADKTPARASFALWPSRSGEDSQDSLSAKQESFQNRVQSYRFSDRQRERVDRSTVPPTGAEASGILQEHEIFRKLLTERGSISRKRDLPPRREPRQRILSENPRPEGTESDRRQPKTLAVPAFRGPRQQSQFHKSSPEQVDRYVENYRRLGHAVSESPDEEAFTAVNRIFERFFQRERQKRCMLWKGEEQQALNEVSLAVPTRGDTSASADLISEKSRDSGKATGTPTPEDPEMNGSVQAAGSSLELPEQKTKESQTGKLRTKTRKNDEILSQERSALEKSRQAPTRLYLEVQEYVLESIRQAIADQPPDLGKGAELVERLISGINEGSSLLLAATDRQQDFAISSHSVNVAILALKIGTTLRHDRETLQRVGLAGLLHEIGVVKLPRKLIYQSQKIDDLQAEQLRQRPFYTSRLLQKLESKEWDWLPKVVEQIYERNDGSGFPRGLVGEQILEEARIIGMADVFEACIHPRPYRSALTGYQSLLELTTEHSKTFSERIVKSLMQSFSLYPYNECVVLNTGEMGRVVDIRSHNLSRPLVKILYDRHGSLMENPRIVDLAQNPSLNVTRALTEFPADSGVPGQ